VTVKEWRDSLSDKDLVRLLEIARSHEWICDICPTRKECGPTKDCNLIFWAWVEQNNCEGDGSDR
jgi:hypothetical protein